MNLIITLKLGAVLLTFDAPEAGSYYLMSIAGDGAARVEASNHVDRACHVGVTVKNEGTQKMFWAVWRGER